MEEPANDNFLPKETNDNRPPPFGRTAEAQWGRLANVAAKLGRLHMFAVKKNIAEKEKAAKKMREAKVIDLEELKIEKDPDMFEDMIKTMERRLTAIEDRLTNPTFRNDTPEEIEKFTATQNLFVKDTMPFWGITEQDINPHEAEVVPLTPKDE